MKPVEIRLVGRFRFTSKVAGTHEHLLFRGLHSQTYQMIFMKGEESKTKPNQHFLSILQEGKILQSTQGGTGIPHMHWCGQEEDYCFIVMEEFKYHLGDMLAKCGKFTHKTVLMIGSEIVQIFQYLHLKNFCHNQINDRNIMLGTGDKCGKLHLLDFSAATRFKDSNNLHVPNKTEGKSEPRLVNLQFSSIKYNSGGTVSRRDDLESMLYLLIYFLKGELPWTSIVRNAKISNAERAKSVLKMKSEIKPEVLFQSYSELELLYKHTLSLGFDEKPRYMFFRSVFSQKMESIGALDDKIYDWMLLEDTKSYEEPEIDFEIVPNQAELIRQIEEELRKKTINEAQQKLENKKSLLSEQVTSPRAREKDCVIY